MSLNSHGPMVHVPSSGESTTRQVHAIQLGATLDHAEAHDGGRVGLARLMRLAGCLQQICAESGHGRWFVWTHTS